MQADEHGATLRAADTGCLLIGDISGYTAYLAGTELEHAQDVLADLLETIIDGLQPVMRVAELEGDAVFAYALDTELQASMLFDTIDQTYFGFRSRVRDIAQATMCECGACRLIPSLDLKFVAHHGRFVRQRVGGGEKPAGREVVLVHRLLKNAVQQATGWTAYALLTEACTEALAIDPGVLGLREHWEHDDELGEVRCWIEDLDRRWREEQERHRVFVLPSEAELEVTMSHPVPVAELWDWHTDPRKRMLWQAAERIDQSTEGGRRGMGTTSHCVHGKDVMVEEILDWRPYRYFTHRSTHPRMGPSLFTFEFFEKGPDTSEVRIRIQRQTGWKRLVWSLMRKRVAGQMQSLEENLARLLAEKQPEGSVN